jgi:hypothetical protein
MGRNIAQDDPTNLSGWIEALLVEIIVDLMADSELRNQPGVSLEAGMPQLLKVVRCSRSSSSPTREAEGLPIVISTVGW